MSTTATTPSAAVLREVIRTRRELLDSYTGPEVLNGAEVFPAYEQRIRDARAELDAALEALPAAEERERQEQAARAAREQADRDRRRRTALERATAAAADAQQAAADLEAAYTALDALVAGSPIGQLLDAAGRLQVSSTAFHAALAVLGQVQLHGDALDDAQRALLTELGPQADAARRALPDGHPARLPATPPALRYRELIQHWLNPHTNGGHT